MTIRLTPATAAAALQVVEAERESARQVGFPATITLSSLVRLRIEREVQECSGSATVQTREHDATNVLAAVAKLRRNH